MRKIEFNTRRPYADNGQIIRAAQLTNGRIVFADMARGIDGILPADTEFTQTDIMRAYDNGNYDWSAESKQLRDCGCVQDEQPAEIKPLWAEVNPSPLVSNAAREAIGNRLNAALVAHTLGDIRSIYETLLGVIYDLQNDCLAVADATCSLDNAKEMLGNALDRHGITRPVLSLITLVCEECDQPLSACNCQFLDEDDHSTEHVLGGEYIALPGEGCE